MEEGTVGKAKILHSFFAEEAPRRKVLAFDTRAWKKQEVEKKERETEKERGGKSKMKKGEERKRKGEKGACEIPIKRGRPHQYK